jgi:hypothetical protein
MIMYKCIVASPIMHISKIILTLLFCIGRRFLCTYTFRRIHIVSFLLRQNVYAGWLQQGWRRIRHIFTPLCISRFETVKLAYKGKMERIYNLGL